MTLYALYELTNYISGRFTAGYSIPPGRFNLVLPECQDEFYSNRLAAKDWDSLRPFRKTIGDDTMGLSVIDGMSFIPPDYNAGGDGYYMMGDVSVGINFVENEQQWTALIKSKIEFPTLEYPAALIQGTRIKFRPKQIKHVVFNYLTKPGIPYLDWCQSLINPNLIIYMPAKSYLKETTTGVYNLMFDNGTASVILASEVIKDGGSDGYVSLTQELLWPEITHWRLLYLILQKCGVNLAEDTVLKWAMEVSKT